MTADWEDPTKVDWANDDADFGNIRTERQGSLLAKCTALYSYTVSNTYKYEISNNLLRF